MTGFLQPILGSTAVCNPVLESLKGEFAFTEVSAGWLEKQQVMPGKNIGLPLPAVQSLFIITNGFLIHLQRSVSRTFWWGISNEKW
jgi:hypothetical protein